LSTGKIITPKTFIEPAPQRKLRTTMEDDLEATAKMVDDEQRAVKREAADEQDDDASAKKPKKAKKSMSEAERLNNVLGAAYQIKDKTRKHKNKKILETS
jgi:hypothetical protein